MNNFGKGMAAYYRQFLDTAKFINSIDIGYKSTVNNDRKERSINITINNNYLNDNKMKNPVTFIK